jgi:hypothetical protein
MCGNRTSQINNVSTTTTKLPQCREENRRHLADVAETRLTQTAQMLAMPTPLKETLRMQMLPQAQMPLTLPMQMLLIPVATGGGECWQLPGDGLYSFQVCYTLPSADAQTRLAGDWMDWQWCHLHLC